MRRGGWALAALLSASVAVAQPGGLPDPTFDPRAWFGSAAAYAAAVAAVVAFIKQHVLTNLSGWRTVMTSFGIAIGGAVAASVTGVFDAAVLEAVAFGASAGLLASGGWDAVNSLLAGKQTRDITNEKGVPMNGVTLIVDTVTDLRTAISSKAGPLAVIEAVRPLLVEFSMSPTVLDENAQADLQHRVHKTLRTAGLLTTTDLTGDLE